MMMHENAPPFHENAPRPKKIYSKSVSKKRNSFKSEFSVSNEFSIFKKGEIGKKCFFIFKRIFNCSKNVKSG